MGSFKQHQILTTLAMQCSCVRFQLLDATSYYQYFTVCEVVLRANCFAVEPFVEYSKRTQLEQGTKNNRFVTSNKDDNESNDESDKESSMCAGINDKQNK